MKTRFFACLFLCLFAWATTTLAQNSLTIEHPQVWWFFEDTGTIEEAVFTMKPQGLYLEVGCYLEISYPENDYGVEDSLEIIFDFNLPQGAIVNDSWLWVGEVIVRAELWDIWTAQQTYEEIVDRQQDPSILYRLPDGSYQLRIFPLVEQESRRIKINYLIPYNWEEETLQAALPMEFLQTSKQSVDQFRVLFYPDASFPDYWITQDPELEFEYINDPEFGPCQELQLTTPYESDLGLSLSLPTQQEGIFVGEYSEGGDQFYQLAVMPEAFIDFGVHKNLCVLINHKHENSTADYWEMLAFLESSLKDHLEEADQFYIIVSTNQGDLVASDTWIPAHPDSIAAAIETVSSVALVDNPNSLSSLLSTGYDFIKNTEGYGEILLLNNDDPYLNTTTANQVMDQLIADWDEVPVYVCDYQNLEYNSVWVNGTIYVGNQYFNLYFSLLTGGDVVSVQGDGITLTSGLEQLFSQFGRIFGDFELYPDVQNGFTYQRFNVSNLTAGIINEPIFQVGKYVGEFPMEVEFFAIHNGTVFEHTFLIEASEVVPLDTLAEEIWVGNYLQAIESDGNSTTEIAHIIDVSIDERVLSKYTAFIALDPILGGEGCYECLNFEDEIIVINTKEEEQPALEFKVFPNPFSDQVNIHLGGAVAKRFTIFNAQGQLVQTLAGNQRSWDGRDASGHYLPVGIYFLVAELENGEKKVVKLSWVPRP